MKVSGGIRAAIVAAPPPHTGVVDRTIGLWRAALIAALAPYLLFLFAEVFFFVAPVGHGLALALAVAAYIVGRRLDFRMAPFAVLLLAIATALTAYASIAWLTIPTCGGGLSGPCFTPFAVAGLGLVSAVAATILVLVGIARLRRIARGGAAVPPL